MSTVRFVHWEDRQTWIGYLDEFPDHLTQGASLAELKEDLRDVYRDLLVVRFQVCDV